ncbi:MAG: DUF296 domain-containing protein [Thermoplasmatales archaeon]|nr:DUF296 domain-containing protein [Thermoplasmatales archaeon]MCW6170241.1 DUF296 domain-containing protein [Thermoplasmatales archaeon]
MQHFLDRRELFLKIEKNESVQNEILGALNLYEIMSGEVTFAIGMIRNLEVGYFDGKEYLKKMYPENLEIVSFHGSIAENEPRLHIHCAGANKDHSVVGGHFFSGVADPLLEVKITKFDGIKLGREKNPASGLSELTILRSKH